MTLREAADFLRVTTGTLLRYRRTGKLPAAAFYRTPGGRWRIDDAAFWAALTGRAAASPKAALDDHFRRLGI